jgi:hypothetical protein
MHTQLQNEKHVRNTIAVHRIATDSIDRLDRIAGALVIISRILLGALAVLVVLSKVRGA